MLLNTEALLKFITSFEDTLRSDLNGAYSPETIDACLTKVHGDEFLLSLLGCYEFSIPLAEAFGKRYPTLLNKNCLMPYVNVFFCLKNMGPEIFLFPQMLLESALHAAPSNKQLLVEYSKRLNQKIQTFPRSWLNPGTIHDSDPGHHPYCFRNASEILVRSISKHPDLSEQVLRPDANNSGRVWAGRVPWKKLCDIGRAICNTVKKFLPKQHSSSPEKTPAELLKKMFDSLDRSNSTEVRRFSEHLNQTIRNCFHVSEDLEQTSQAAAQRTTGNVCVLNDLRNISDLSGFRSFNKSSLCRHDSQDLNPKPAIAIVPDRESAPNRTDLELPKNPSSFFSRSVRCDEDAIQPPHCEATPQEGRLMRAMTM